MKLVDQQWLVRDNGIFHLCRGDEEAKGPNKKISQGGFWPVTEEFKCPVCQAEAPNHARLYLTK